MVAKILATKFGFVPDCSGNGLLPDGTKLLPEPMLTDPQWSPVTFILGQFHKRCLNHQSPKSVWKFHWNLPGANELPYSITDTSRAGSLKLISSIFCFPSVFRHFFPFISGRCPYSLVMVIQIFYCKIEMLLIQKLIKSFSKRQHWTISNSLILAWSIAVWVASSNHCVLVTTHGDLDLGQHWSR